MTLILMELFQKIEEERSLHVKFSDFSFSFIAKLGGNEKK
jgi:hypothetical protein